MEREKLYLLQDTIDVDWIEDNAYDAYIIISELIKDNLWMQDKLQINTEVLELANKVTKQLNKENKKLKKDIDKITSNII